MSREVRRVPLDWQHPTEPNPYWRDQAARRLRRAAPESLLHAREVRFIGLMDDYPGAVKDWEERGAELAARTGHTWSFNVEYHLTCWQKELNAAPEVHPFYVWDEVDDAEVPVTVRDEDHLHKLLLAKHDGERPNPNHHMPVFALPEAELGWCLYETVSEGTPVTPVFATADALIDHLATVGQDWDQRPLRRESAEQIVRTGFTFGSMVVSGGRVLNSTDDADVIAGLGS